MSVEITKNIEIDSDNLVHINFECKDDQHTLKDCIVISKGEYDNLNEQQIQEIIDYRWNNWIAAITPAPVENIENGSE